MLNTQYYSKGPKALAAAKTVGSAAVAAMLDVALNEPWVNANPDFVLRAHFKAIQTMKAVVFNTNSSPKIIIGDNIRNLNY
jgi:hypothetical protein